MASADEVRRGSAVTRAGNEGRGDTQELELRSIKSKKYISG